VKDADSPVAAHGGYLRTFCVTLALVLTGIALFNFCMDPYSLFAHGFDARWNRIKTRPESNIGAVKLLNAESAQPRALILGNSRADIGFDPGHAAWGAYRGRVYNLAVPGAGIEAARDNFAALLRGGGVEMAVLAVDFQDFVINAGDPLPDGVSRVPDTQELRRKEQLAALFTLGGTLASLGTVHASTAEYPASLRQDGFNPLLDYVPIAKRDGYAVMFQQRLNETAAKYVRGRRGLFPPGAQDSSEFQAFGDVLRLAQEHRVRLVVTTYPYHAQYYLLYRELGLWPAFEQWKRNLVAAVDESVRSAATVAPPVFCDHAALSGPATTMLEESDASGASHWYWEAGHFKKELGDLVLANLLGRPPGHDRTLGACLDGATIGPWLSEQQRILQGFSADHGDLLRQVRQALGRAGWTGNSATGS